MTQLNAATPFRSPRNVLLVLRSALWAGGVSAAINTLLYLIFRAGFSTLQVGQPGAEAPFWPGAVVLFSVVGALGAGLVFAVMGRLTPHPERPFVWLAWAVLLASFVMLLGLRNPTLGVVLVLALMHVMVCLCVLRWIVGREATPPRR